jgi:hypothetical protein
MRGGGGGDDACGSRGCDFVKVVAPSGVVSFGLDGWWWIILYSNLVS